jgi:hypothetical protein
MDIRLLMKFSRKIETLEHHLQEGLQAIRDSCHNVQRSFHSIDERYIMEDMRDEYTREVYVSYDFEVDCVDWYIDYFHFLNDNHFHVFFMTLLHLYPLLPHSFFMLEQCSMNPL